MILKKLAAAAPVLAMFVAVVTARFALAVPPTCYLTFCAGPSTAVNCYACCNTNCGSGSMAHCQDCCDTKGIC